MDDRTAVMLMAQAALSVCVVSEFAGGTGSQVEVILIVRCEQRSFCQGL